MGDIGKLSGKESGHATMYSGKAYTPGTGNAPRRIVRMDTENGYDDQPERRVPRLRPEAEGKHRSDSETQRRHVREHTRGTNDSMERGHDTDTGRRRIARLVESQEQRERPRHSHEKRNDRQERSQYMQEKHECLMNLSQDSS